MSMRSVLLLIAIATVTFRFPQLTTSTVQSLSKGKSLAVENPDDVLVSPNGVFSAGFFSVGHLAYCFGVRFTKPSQDGNYTVVWMANRDQPINGKHSKLSLSNTGDLILKDAGQLITWRANTFSKSSSVQLLLNDTGNLVLTEGSEHLVLWQSFASPTDTLLSQQQLTKDTKLISSRSKWNYSSGYYKLSFDDSNVLRLVFDDSKISSIYWPEPGLLDMDNGRSRYNYSRTAVFGDSGRFISSDKIDVRATDFGSKVIRRLTLDYDGNLRMYSLDESTGSWNVSWQAVSAPCRIHGICGENGVCAYDPSSGHKCSCLPGFMIKNQSDWTQGCKPEFTFSCKKNERHSFVPLRHIDFYGYNYHVLSNFSLKECEKKCLELCCKGFLYRFYQNDNAFKCYLKWRLRNGHRSLNFNGTLYLRVPKPYASLYDISVNRVSDQLYCSGNQIEHLGRPYVKGKGNTGLKILVWLASAIGFVELACAFMICTFLYKSHYSSERATKGYVGVALGFRRYSYSELKKATGGFREEIGRGASGVVYKGVLSDQRVAAIKRLNEANQGEDEFLAEVSTIGRLNHMNLIDMWGYCSEGRQRLLVYEFMENGSLEDELHTNSLNWKKRLDIAVGTAKGLAYLHEECLEWVLHCDVKPQNILLDSSYNPKVADFGLSKIVNGKADEKSGFSRIRGTRGYMAPEWIYNLPITSKVDVYSYGVVLLEMLTGRNPTTGVNAVEGGADQMEQQTVVAWIRQKKVEAGREGSNWLEQVLDPSVGTDYDADKLEVLIDVALQCMEEDRFARPSMSHVVETLLPRQN